MKKTFVQFIWLGEQLLEAGTHKFPFRFKLPTQLPSSFDGEYGFIRYTVTVKVEYPTEPSQEIERRITIIKSQDVCHPDFQVFRNISTISTISLRCSFLL